MSQDGAGRGSAALAFHASPAPGHWLNDPNGLVFADGAYRLFAQHRIDAPGFRETGWARFSSSDLLRWHFDGVAIAPQNDHWAYSGCVLGNGNEKLVAVHTDHSGGLEQQVERYSRDAGQRWSAPLLRSDLGRAARNRRDPYVFRHDGGWGLLLAEPCDWTDWRDAPPSQLQLYRSSDRSVWQHAATIGPWRPAGIMWEVPLLLRIGEKDVLIVSEIDRRAGGAPCSVRAWPGTLRTGAFERDDPADDEGQRLDAGPDFYAMMASTEKGWPLPYRVCVGWLSNWDDARTLDWPGFAGGPISLGRTLSMSGSNVVVEPAKVVLNSFCKPAATVPRAGVARIGADGSYAVELCSAQSKLSIAVDRESRTVHFLRSSRALSTWSSCRPLPDVSDRCEMLVFVDGPAVEVFIAGHAASFFVACDGSPFEVVSSGNALTTDWFVTA